MDCEVTEKIVALQGGFQHPSRLRSYDAMEFAVKQARIAQKGGFHRVGIKFRSGGSLTPAMVRKACTIVGGVEVRFIEPQMGVFVAEFAKIE